MLSSSRYLQNSLKQAVRCFATVEPVSNKSFKNTLLSCVLDENKYNHYATLVSATGTSLLDGYLETINKKEDRLLVVSNGSDGDAIAKRAFEMGIPVEWSFHPLMFPMDADEAAQDVVYRERITHVIFEHVESFTGAVTPLRQIITKLRKVRRDVSICIDNRNGYYLHSMPILDDIIDYSIHQTNILNIQPNFGFMIAHLPAILAEANRHRDHVLSSIYNNDMSIERMMPAIQDKYMKVMEENSWQTMSYKYEETKAKLVNKVKILLPVLPYGFEQGCYAAAFLVPQEIVGLRELLTSLEEINIPVSHQFITPAMPAISFSTRDLIQYEDEGGELMDIYKCIERVTRRRKGEFNPDMTFIKSEREYRKKQIFGEKTGSIAN